MKKLILSGLLIGSQLLVAKSLIFEHHDWEVVCDNSNLCRIVGYSSDEAEHRLSVLLSREAGAKQEIKAKVQLAYFGEEEGKIFNKLPSPFKLEMFINNKSYGSVLMGKDELMASLSKKQTKALVNSLKRDSTIIWKHKNYSWELSDKGASAVLLKTDEFQKRLGTRGAFYKKGSKSEKNVLKPQPLPTLYAQPISNAKEVTLDPKYMERLDKKLVLDKEECFSLNERENELTFYNLSSTKLLATKLCWMAAYNAGSAYWVINKKPPFEPNLITTNGTDYYVSKEKIGILSANHKGRGLGDCWSYERYVWTGKTFELSADGSTGQCRAIAAGGAWDLPTFVSKVKVK